MPQARDEAGNIWEVDAQGNPVRLISQGGAPQGAIPIGPRDTSKATAQSMEAERLRLAQDASARAAAAEARAQQMAGIEAQLKQLEVQKRQQEVTKGATGGTQGAKIDQAALKRASLEALTKQLNEVEGQFQTKFTGQGDRGLLEYLPTPQNRQFDAAAAGLSEQALGAFRVPGIGSQSDAELRAFIEANRPSAMEYDEVNQQRLNNIRTRLDEQRAAMGLSVSQRPGQERTEAAGLEQRNPFDQDSYGGGGAASGGGLGGAITGNTGFRTVNDQALADEAWKMWKSGKSLNDINAMIQAKYPGTQSIVPNAETFEYARTHPDWNPFSATRQVPLSRRQSATGSAPAAALAGALNMGSLGGVQALAPEQYAAISAANPGSTMGGEVLGAIGGTQGIGMLGRGIMQRLAPQTLGGGSMARFGRNLATDMTYGAGYGGVTEGDPLGGALAAGAGSALGQGAGTVLGKAAAGLKVDPAADVLAKYGIDDMTVAQRLGGIPKSMEDRVASTMPIVGDMVNARRLEGLQKFNQAAFNEAGAPIGAATRNIGEQGVDDLRNAAGGAYDQAVQGTQVSLDPQFVADIQAARQVGKALPPDLAAKFELAMQNRVRPAVDTGQITGEQYQQAMRGLKGYKGEHTKSGFEGDYRDAISAAQNALKGQMMRGGGEQVVSGLGKADEAYRMTKVLEDAVRRARNGTRSGEVQTFMPSQLNDAATANARKFPGPRPFAELADAGQKVLPSAIPDSGTAGRLAQLALPGALGGGGYALGGPEGAAGTLGVVGLLAALSTKSGQKALGKLLIDRPEKLKKLGAVVNKKKGLFGSATVPLALEAQQ